MTLRIGELVRVSIGEDGFNDDGDAGLWLVGSIPGWTAYRLGVALYQSRYLLDSGWLFFDSSDPLVAVDTNGMWDVYEWEPEGSCSC
jgi:hypothetical protein